MTGLNITQKYTLCALDPNLAPKLIFLKDITKKSIQFDGKYFISMLISIFFELYNRGVIKFDPDKKIKISKKTDFNENYLKIIYDKISLEPPKTLMKWCEYFYFSFNKKNYNNIIDEIIFSLIKEKVLFSESKKGLLKNKEVYTIKKSVLNDIIEEIRSNISGKTVLSNDTAILVLLFEASDMIKKCLTKEEMKLYCKIKDEIKSRNKEWKIKEIIDQVNTKIITTTTVT